MAALGCPLARRVTAVGPDRMAAQGGRACPAP